MAFISTNDLTLVGERTGKPVEERRMKPFNKAVLALCKASNEPNTEDMIKYFGNLSPLYGNALRSEMLELCLAAQKPRSVSGLRHWMVLFRARLLEKIPFKAGKTATRYFLSNSGFGLMDHLAERYKRFTPYWELFQSQQVRDMAALFLTCRGLNVVPPIVEEAAAFNAAFEKRQIEAEKAEREELTRMALKNTTGFIAQLVGDDLTGA